VGRRLTFALDDGSSPNLDYESSPPTVDCALWCVDNKANVPISFFDGAGSEDDNNMGIKLGDRVLVRGKVKFLNERVGREVIVQHVQKVSEEEEAYFWCDMVRVHEMIVNTDWEMGVENVAEALEVEAAKDNAIEVVVDSTKFDNGGISDDNLMGMEIYSGSGNNVANESGNTEANESGNKAAHESRKRPLPPSSDPPPCTCPPAPPTALISILKLQPTFPSNFCHCKCSALNPPSLDPKFTFRDAVLFMIFNNSSGSHNFSNLKADNWMVSVAKEVVGDNEMRKDHLLKEVLRVCSLDGILFDNGAGEYKLNPMYGKDG